MSPEMFGRIDDSKFQTGVATMRNFVATPQGPAENRAGFRFVRAVKDSTKRVRLIPFTFSTSQTAIIEVGPGYFRFHINGATLAPPTIVSAYSGALTYVPGSLVESGGVIYYCVAQTTGNAPPNAMFWYAMPAGIYEIPSPYAEADLFDLHYVQSNDVVTIVHPSYAPRELRRSIDILGRIIWTLPVIDFGSTVTPPTVLYATPSSGFQNRVTAVSVASPATFTTSTQHGLATNDSVYLTGINLPTVPDGFYVVATVPSPTTLTLKDYSGNAISNATAYTSVGNIQWATQTAEVRNTYVVTSIDGTGLYESAASAPLTVANNLNVVGAYNTLSFGGGLGAVRYNVYKAQAGMFGFIGQSTGTTFVDDNIAPDLGVTPPNFDTTFLSANNYPGAVSYFEQRRVFAGTNNAPASIWMTRSGTESQMSYSIPIQDDDRIAFRVAAREANTIRHVVPLGQLILLTSAAEWRVSPVNSDVITPTSISVRPQSYIGSSNVQPAIVNNSLVYCAARGGHVRELGYSWQSNGYITGDISIRAAHLFDGLEIADMTFAKAPHPVLWFVSSNGRLLGLTYIPEQQVGSWHWHDTDGAFESCAAVPEGAEDVLYAVVRRTVNGQSVRYIERMASRGVQDRARYVFADSSLTYDGTNTATTLMRVTGGTTWGPPEVLTLTSMLGNAFTGASDVGDEVVLTAADGQVYRIRITAYTSPTSAQGIPDRVIPASLRGVFTASWSWARDTVSGLSHLEGKTVSILADGGVMSPRVVSAGSVTLDKPATIVTVGLPYYSDLKTMPITLNIPAFSQGQAKNVNAALIRVYRSSGIYIGPSESKLTEAKLRTTEPYTNPPSLVTEDVEVMVSPSWQRSGQVLVRQVDPLPLTVVGLTVDVALGG